MRPFRIAPLVTSAEATRRRDQGLRIGGGRVMSARRWDEPPLRALRRQRRVESICRTPRLTFELLVEFAERHGCLDELDNALAWYAALPPETIRALGADRFPPAIFPRDDARREPIGEADAA
jgi:hypothetical protein